VEISGDLQVAKVYVSVMGSEAQGRTTLRGLTHAAGHIQRLLSQHWHARHCPEIRFLLDESIKGSMRTIQIIEDSLKESGGGGEDQNAPFPESLANDADGAGA
jgi:ribosome-binding factor A